VVVRLNGEFDHRTQAALREGFAWITGPVIIDLSHAWLAAAGLGEVMALAKRIGIENVILADPTPIMRRILAVTQIDRVLSVRLLENVTPLYKKTA